MDSENVAVIAGIGAGAGAVVSNSGVIPVISGSGIVPALFGVGVAGVAYFVLKTDYLTEGLIGFGVGWTLNALL